MENFEAISFLEFLVKAASLDAAGISAIFVGIIGVYIIRIPNDVTTAKASLLKFFMGICAFMVIVCGLSTWANAYFTHDKVVESQNVYEAETERVETKNNELTAQLKQIRDQLESPGLSPQDIRSIRSDLEQTNTQLQSLQMRPFDEVREETRRRPEPLPRR